MRSTVRIPGRSLAMAVLLWLFASFPGVASALTNEGTRFLVGFGEHQVSTTATSFFLTVTGAPGTIVTYEISGSETSVTIGSTGLAVLAFPPPAVQVIGSDVFGPGVLVTSTAPVRVWASSFADPSLDGALVLPVAALGTEYFVLSSPQSASSAEVAARSQFLIVANEDDTLVTIAPRIATSGRPAAPYTITLGRAQAYQLQTELQGTDLSGTQITANKPVAVFAGGSCLQVPANDGFCSHLVEQLPPVAAWDKQYFVVPLPTSANGTRVRIIASAAGTQLTYSGGLTGITPPLTLASPGDFGEFILPPDRYLGIASNEPILVMEYSQGTANPFGPNNPSPFMTLAPGVQRYAATQRFATPSLPMQNEVGIIIQDDVSLCTLNGASLAAYTAFPIGATGFMGVRVQGVPSGANTLSCPRPFGAIVYGAPTPDGSPQDFRSYGYPAGYFFSSAAAPVANAGADITVLEGALVTLDGSASRSETGQPLRYSWVQVSPASPRVSMTTTDPARPTFVAPDVLAATTFTFSLVVTSDAEGSSTPALVNVTVIDRGVVPPPVGCASSVLTVADLRGEVATVTSSAVTIALLDHTLSKVESAVGSRALKLARLGMLVFLTEVVVRSDSHFARAHRLNQDDANRLICGAANVLTKISP